MVASGNVGLAFGLVFAAGMATALGATIVFCADVAKPRLLAGSLGFAAGVMLYVSFAEIFLRKSIQGFVDADYSDVEAYRYATLTFFGGFIIIAILDKLVHLIADCAGRRGQRMETSQSQAVLLDNEDAVNDPTVAPRQATAVKTAATGTVISSDDIEAATGNTSSSSIKAKRTASPTAKTAAAAAAAATLAKGCCSNGHGCTSNKNNNNTNESRNNNNNSDTREEEEDEEEEDAKPANATTSREPPAVVDIMKNDPHAFALKKMGILTAIAIFIHNFPEGLATFVGALADTSIGIGIAVAIAMHNIPEGICVAMPIYYATGSKWKGFWWAMLSGLSEPVGALVGWAALSGQTDLSFALVFALVAGMMVYISVKELIPTALKYDPSDTVATTCVVLGMVVMAASLLLFTL